RPQRHATHRNTPQSHGVLHRPLETAVACDAIRDGVNSGLSFGSARAKADKAVGWAQQDMGLSLSMPDGMFLVEAAEHQLC
ncbi:hypothetical protein, partial [Mycolicibacterium chubuense]|uniref:hypothetical protein n=1 Tax=Mycolicibacterium chubuense TaxID=1800 RepID=UPI001A987985